MMYEPDDVNLAMRSLVAFMIAKPCALGVHAAVGASAPAFHNVCFLFRVYGEYLNNQ